MRHHKKPVFQQRHYEELAGMLKEWCNIQPTGRLPHFFAKKFAEDNPRFSRERFLRACGESD